METAVFGGGCFWCTEAVFDSVQGVESVESGYCGGYIENPSYRQVCEGNTGHIEVIRIRFDESQISYDTLLDIFFATHDPTTPGRQGNDIGPQYQSVIYIENDEQARLARLKIEQLTKEKAFTGEISTLIKPSEKFWPAEDYHDKYFEKNPYQSYCQYVVLPKVLKLKSKFPDLLRK